MLTDLRYKVNDRPPLLVNLMFGLQWFIISVTSTIILGKVAAGMHFADPGIQVTYMQKLFFLMGLSMFIQVLWGHGLPLVTGPSAALMVGIIAGMGRGIDSIYTAIAIGGLFLVLLNITGIFARLTSLFTSRVVACILILIALSLTPVIIGLVASPVLPNGVDSSNSFFFNLAIALFLLLFMIVADQKLKGMLKTTMLVWAILGGSFLVYWRIPSQVVQMPDQLSASMNFFRHVHLSPTFDSGVVLAFVICMIALAINDLGSMHAVGRVVNTSDMEGRVKRGIFATGLCNIIAGGLGVLGPVNFSFSAGIIASNGNGSRFSLIPAALGMIILALFPCLLAVMWAIPKVVVGTVLLYVMSTQLSAGFLTAFSSKSFTFQDGMILGVPAMICIVVSYLPPEVKQSFPGLLVPILGNGFVVGGAVALILEHLVYSDSREKA